VTGDPNRHNLKRISYKKGPRRPSSPTLNISNRNLFLNGPFPAKWPTSVNLNKDLFLKELFPARDPNRDNLNRNLFLKKLSMVILQYIAQSSNGEAKKT